MASQSAVVDIFSVTKSKSWNSTETVFAIGGCIDSQDIDCYKYFIILLNFELVQGADSMGSTLSRLGQVGALDVAIQFACFVVAAALKTEKFYDFSASCTYILLILFSYNNFKHDYLLSSSSSSSPASFGPTRSFINSTLVCLWAARLGSFLLRRILHDGKDSRFDKVRDRPSRFFVYWMVQALWIFLTALPVYIINCNKDDALSSSSSSVGESPLGVRDVVGWSMWVIGFLIESTADAQKSAFKNNPRNKGKFIDTGLWYEEGIILLDTEAI